MLSKNAFNALLKTLEEPPAHVKFIFATTEIRKIPITILSRCQRFDLRRIDNEILVPFLQKITEKENAEVEHEALEMIANASEGSVRDSLSLLDQAISHSDAKVTAAMARDMLGLADKTKVIDIFENITKGDTPTALGILKELYDASADPVLIVQDLLEFTYLVTKLKILPNLSLAGFVPENEVKRARELAEKLQMSYLTRCWQMLLKGLSEAKVAPNTFSAVEMILIRLTYISDAPPPAALIKKIQDNSARSASVNVSSGAYAPQGAPSAQYAAAPQPQTYNEPVAMLNNFEQVVALFQEKREVLLYNWLHSDVRLISFKTGKIELSLSASVPSDFPKNVSARLREWTGQNWMVVASNAAGQATLQEQKTIEDHRLKEKLAQHPSVKKILEIFPGAYIKNLELGNKN